MKIAVLAKGKRGEMAIKTIRESKHELVLRVNQEGVGNPTAINLPALLRTKEADLVVLAGWSWKVSKEVIDIPPKGIINLHGGKVPEYRGASVLNWQIIQGETAIGLTILYVTPDDYDAGSIIWEDSFLLPEDSGIDEAVEASLRKFPGMLRLALDKIENGLIENTPNGWACNVPWTKRQPEDSLIKFHEMTDQQAHNFIRALGSRDYPPAFAYGRGRKFHFWRSRLCPIQGLETQPGRYIAKWPGMGILIGVKFGPPLMVTILWDEEKKEPYSASRIDLPIGTLFSEKGGC